MVPDNFQEVIPLELFFSKGVWWIWTNAFKKFISIFICWTQPRSMRLAFLLLWDPSMTIDFRERAQYSPCIRITEHQSHEMLHHKWKAFCHQIWNETHTLSPLGGPWDTACLSFRGPCYRKIILTLFYSEFPKLTELLPLVSRTCLKIVPHWVV